MTKMTIQERQKLVQLCRALINEEIDILEGCRQIKLFRWDLSEEEQEYFLTFIVVASDTDTYPTPESRHLYSESFLKREDKQIQDYLEEAKPDIIASCYQLIERYRIDDR